VLLALVALHSSTLIELASSERLQKNGARLKPAEDCIEDQRVSSMLEEMLGSEIEERKGISKDMYPSFWDLTLRLWQADETKCAGDLFALLAGWLRTAKKKKFKDTIRNAITRWGDTCYSRLEVKIQSQLGTMSDLTRKHFELFTEQDQRECRSEGGPGCLFLVNSNSAFGVLRQLIGSPEGVPSADQLGAARRFVSACKEMTDSDSIKTTRTQFQNLRPDSTQSYFPHIRFYDYCRQLLDFDLSTREFDDVLRQADYVNYFGRELGKIFAQGQSRADFEKISSETAESVSERERSVAEAAVRFATWHLDRFPLSRDGEFLTQGRRLDLLRNECSKVLHKVDNLIWMYQHVHDLVGHEHLGQRTSRTERNLMYSAACKQLVQLENEAAGMEEETLPPVIEKQRPRKWFPNVMPGFGRKNA
jgi:hypothetical protein